jgi:hypothetical protein
MCFEYAFAALQLAPLTPLPGEVRCGAACSGDGAAVLMVAHVVVK